MIKPKNVLQDHLPKTPTTTNLAPLPVPLLPSHPLYKHFYYI